MATARLAKRTIDAARYTGDPAGKAHCILWDSALPGFGLRVYPSGAKSFIVAYRSGGRKRRMVLGPYGLLTPAQAREAASDVLRAARREGRDPLAERRARAKAERFEDLAALYLERHAIAKKKPRSSAEDRRLLDKFVLPTLGRFRLDGVTRADVARLHHGLRVTPYQANRVLALLSKMFNLAEQWGLRPDGSNPCRHVERFREAKRERFLSAEELARLAAALEAVERDGSESPWAVAAVRLLTFTGARLGEVLTMRWQDLDLDAGRWRLPDSKTGPKTVPLPAPARQVLAELSRTEGNPYVIEGRREGGHLSDLEKVWQRIRERAKLNDVRIHDLRHSFASVGACAGLSLPMIGKLLGHTQAATTLRYAHLAADPVQDAAEQVAARIQAAMTGGGAVLPFGRRAGA